MIRAFKKLGAVFSAVALLGTMLALVAGAAPAGASGVTVVVGAGDVTAVHSATPAQEWSPEDTDANTGTYGFVAGPAGAPSGTGSLAMSVTNTQHEWLIDNEFGFCSTGPSCTATGVLLSSITAGSYSTYRTSGGQMPTLNIEVSPPGDSTGYTTFVYVPDATAYLNNTWQTWNPFTDTTARWYSTHNVTNPPGGTFNCTAMSPACTRTWAQITASYGSGRVLGGIGPNIGTGGTFVGNVDALVLNNTTYDFEPDCTTTCYVSTTGNDNNTGLSTDPLRTIQAGVNKVSSGGTVQVAAGTYVENVTVTKPLTLAGASQTSTIIEPALEGPDPSGCGSLCAGASSVILVQSSNVTVHDIGINGDNPGLSSGNPPVDGADIDARNGIITDHTLGPVFNALSVHDTTVKNVYLRGIYASTGGTFNFTNDTIDNVQADPSSVAMFNFGGSGTMSGNHVSNSSDAISANHSTGTTFTNNVITSSASGVHTDNNGDSGGTADVVSGNHVSACTAGGYGVWAFVPYLAPTFSNNVVTGCNVGMAVIASCDIGGITECPASTIPTVTLTGNTVTNGSGDTGLYVTTNSFGFGDGDTHVAATNNTITGSDDGVFVEETGAAHATVSATRNSLAGDTVHGINNTGATTVTGTCNWWGAASGPSGVAPGSGSAVTAGVTYAPFLTTSNLAGTCAASVSIGADQTFAEGNSGGTTPDVIPVTLSSAQATAVTVHWTTANGTAKKGQDYLAGSGILTFAPGVTSQNIVVSVDGDLTGEPNESFTVVLSSPVGVAIGDGSTTITLLNDDLAAKKMKGAKGYEGASIPFTVNISYPMASATTLHFCTTAGTATEGGPTADYTFTECSAAPGSNFTAVTLPAGTAGPVTVSVPTHVDMTTEPNEFFTMTVTAVGSSFTMSAKGEIKANKI